MAQFFSTIGRHLECAIQTELVVELELALIERKQYRRFRHNSINMPGRYERVCVGWHCAKVKGHAELKIVKSQSEDLYLRFPQMTPFQPQQFRC